MTHRRLEERVRAVTESLHRKYGPVSSALLKAVRTAILSGILDGHEGAAARVAAAHDPLITAMLADYRAGVIGASAEAVPIISGFTEALGAQGVRDARAGLTTAGVTPSTAAEVVRARVDDGPLHRLLVARAGQHADRVGDALVDGVARGAGPVDVSRALRVAAEGPFRNAVLVARTEGLRAYRESTLGVYQASPVVTQWRWSCRNGERSCGACVALDGEVFDTDQPMEVHISCMCTLTAVLPDFDPGPSGREQLAGWDPDVQDRVLGPAMGAAYRDGVIDLSDLPVATSHPEWGGGLRTATLTELVGAERAAGYVAAVRAGF